MTKKELNEALRKRFLSNMPSYDGYEYYVREREQIVDAFNDEKIANCLERDFEKGSGGELNAAGTRPPKMHAVYSSSAQCVNAFAVPAYGNMSIDGLWKTLLGTELLGAMKDMGFERQYKVNLLQSCKNVKGTPPNLDFAIECEGGIIAIESKLGEIFEDHDQTISNTYFTKSILADERNVALCDLARRVHLGEEKYTKLNAAQLIKHSLGLMSACQEKDSFKLGYFYNEAASCNEHDDQVEKFRDSMSKAGVKMFVSTYQDMIKRLNDFRCDDPAFVKYRRWFSDHYLLDFKL